MSKKLIQAAAGAGGESVYVEDVFSTYLYTGNDTTQTVTTGLDIANEGGLIWQKPRVADAYNNDHKLFDTERGQNKVIYTNNSAVEDSGRPLSYTSTGFTLDTSSKFYGLNENNKDYVTWNFVKQAGFFDVVTWTGDGTSNRQITHNLGSVPGCIIVKRLNSTANWAVWHRGFNSASTIGGGFLNLTNAFGNEALFSNNSSAFSDSYFLVSSSVNRETNGYLDTYVAYVFAHDDQQFGDNSDESIIKCGSYTGNGSTQEINLGFEPQWIMFKNTTNAASWAIFDVMRGMIVGGNDNRLNAESSGAEYTATNYVHPTPTGVQLESSASIINTSGATYIYIAIRRPMKTPEAGTEVFNVNYNGSTGDGNVPAHRTTFPVDMFFWKDVNNSGSDIDWFLFDRLRGMSGKALHTNTTDAEGADPYPASWEGFDLMDGVIKNTSSYTDYYAWMFKRATGFFDVVAYTGDGNATQDINHNLGVSPNMIIVKQRTNSGTQWPQWNSETPNHSMYLNSTIANIQTGGGQPYYVGQSVSSTTFRVSTDGSANQSNGSGNNYIAYLFATLAGVSKVGSYTGTGSSQTIDCGFSSGARFVLIKRTDSGGNWLVFDTARGITVGSTDGTLTLDTTTQEYSESVFFSNDVIQPDSSGFKVLSSASLINDSGGSYIFLAIA